MEDTNGKARILVIDDEPEFVSLLKSQLELEGYTVLTALDGEDGVTKAHRESPDLVICDIRMPLKNGHEVLEALRTSNFSAPFISSMVLESTFEAT